MSRDLAIIGAGPAGSWAAYQLARRGARVTLFDDSHPREKPCGGGITGRAMTMVSGALAGHELRTATIRRARFVDSATGKSSSVGLADGVFGPDLVVASRTDFDRALMAAACAAGALFVSARVTGVALARGCVQIHTRAGTYRAAHAIGADGANSLVRRSLARSFTRAQLSIATGYFAHGVSSDEIVVELVADPPGYIWSFPRPTHLAIGICAQADSGVSAAALRARTKRWIDETHIADGAQLEPYSWPIPSLSAGELTSPVVSGPQWFLVGDAAGLVDPITREGIYFALRSAGCAADALSTEERSPHVRYAERVRDEMAADLSRAARYTAGFFRSRFTRLMIDALADSAPIRAVMADLVAGRQDYRSLKWRLARTLEVGWMWRALHLGS